MIQHVHMYDLKGQLKMTYIWNGEYFIDHKRHQYIRLNKDVKGETLRVGSPIFPPHTGIITLPNGPVISLGGVEVSTE